MMPILLMANRITAISERYCSSIIIDTALKNCIVGIMRKKLMMNRDVFHFQTSEKVRIEYEIAPLLHRSIAFLIDASIKVVAFIAIYLLLIFFALGSAIISQYINLGNLPPLVMVGLIIAFSLFMLFYGLVFEWLWKGQTPGKRLMRLRAVHDDGTFIGFTSAVLRNIFRLVDLLPMGYLVGFTTAALNQRRRRIGDYVAGTLVIRERGMDIPRLEESDENLFALLKNLGECITPSLIEIIDDYLRSKSSMEKRALEKIERELVSLIEARTGVRCMENMSSSVFIASLRRNLP